MRLFATAKRTAQHKTVTILVTMSSLNSKLNLRINRRLRRTKRNDLVTHQNSVGSTAQMFFLNVLLERSLFRIEFGLLYALIAENVTDNWKTGKFIACFERGETEKQVVRLSQKHVEATYDMFRQVNYVNRCCTLSNQYLLRHGLSHANDPPFVVTASHHIQGDWCSFAMLNTFKSQILKNFEWISNLVSHQELRHFNWVEPLGANSEHFYLRLKWKFRDTEKSVD